MNLSQYTQFTFVSVPQSRAGSKRGSADRRKNSLEASIKEVVAVDKSWGDSEEDSDTSGIAEEDEDSASPANMSSARVVLETEIKFNEETAITMTILEDREREAREGRGRIEEEEEEDEAVGEVDEGEPEERRKTPR